MGKAFDVTCEVEEEECESGVDTLLSQDEIVGGYRVCVNGAKAMKIASVFMLDNFTQVQEATHVVESFDDNTIVCTFEELVHLLLRCFFLAHNESSTRT